MLKSFIKSKKESYYLNFQPPAEIKVNINAFFLKTCSFGFKYNAPWLIAYEDDMVLLMSLGVFRVELEAWRKAEGKQDTCNLINN